MNQVWSQLLPQFLRKRLEDQQDLQKIIANISWLFADRVLRLCLSLVVGVWVARYLGPEQFGLYNYAVAFVSLFSVLSTLGLDGIVVRNIVQEPTKQDEILSTVLVLKLISSTVVMLISIAAIFLFKPNSELIHWLVGIIATGSIFKAFDAIDFWFQSQVQSKYTVYSKNSAFILVAITKIILIQIQAPVIAFAWSSLAENCISAIGLMAFYAYKGYTLRLKRFSFSCTKQLLKDSWPLMLSSFLIMIYMRIDQVMLGELIGDQEVGIYAASVKLAEIWYFVPMIIASSTFPSVVESRQVSEVRLYKKMQKLYNLMALLAYCTAIPMTFLAQWIVNILFGEEYARAGSILAILAWAAIFVNLGVARSSFLTTMNWTSLHFKCVFWATLMNVTLNFILIPIYGGIGAAISTCISYWFSAYGSCFLYKPLRKTGMMMTKSMFLGWSYAK